MRAALLFCLLIKFARCYTNYQFVIGPPDKSVETYRAWSEFYHSWRQDIRDTLDLSNYELEEVQWARSSFVQPQVMIHDRYLFDRETNEWTVKRFLDDLRERYGGVDSVLLWGNYPNIGVDDRNQFDMLTSMPGGIEALAEAVAEFQREGVRVLMPYNPWDQFTRDTGVPDYESLLQVIVDTSSDGFNGDTLDGVDEVYWNQGIELGHPIVIEPEVLMSNFSYLATNLMSWGYWTPGAKSGYDVMEKKIRSLDVPGPTILPIPFIAAYKAITDSRHLTHLTERWAMNHNDGIQQALFSGIGFESWENIWGIWNGLTERDSEALRRVSSILRMFNDTFQYPGVFYPCYAVLTNLTNNIYGSMFMKEDHEKPREIYVFVNRNLGAEETDRVRIDCITFTGQVLYDIYHGTQMDVHCQPGESVVEFELKLEAGGYAAFLQTLPTEDEDFLDFMDKMKVMSEKPLSEYSSVWSPLQQTIETYNPIFDGTFMPDENTVLVKGTESYAFLDSAVCIEGNRLPNALDVQYPWEETPRREHNHTMAIPDLYMDKYPVTNLDYYNFIQDSAWQPSLLQNWLQHWTDDVFPEGSEKQPVIWVSHADARAYCNFYGKRLPHSWEWQYAAQGLDGRGWPWGEANSTRMPEFTDGRAMPPPDDVDAHEDGASPAGIVDMVGNVLQWTDVFTDDHTSKAVLRGSNRWRPTGLSETWYFPMTYGEHRGRSHSGWEYWENQGPLYEHATLLMHSDSMDRSAGIGFRCVADV